MTTPKHPCPVCGKHRGEKAMRRLAPWSTLHFAVWCPDGPAGRQVVAYVKWLEDAAAFIGAVGFNGYTVTYKGHVLWTEGDEEHPAEESYDGAARVMLARYEAAEGAMWCVVNDDDRAVEEGL